MLLTSVNKQQCVQNRKGNACRLHLSTFVYFFIYLFTVLKRVLFNNALSSAYRVSRLV
jgi:hypothetical protein